MKLSVLDQSPIIKGQSPTKAIEETLELARLAEDLGYHRFWLAEHHNMNGLADPCPEILIAAIGQNTKRIRIGTGGVLLPYYSPAKVAEIFRMHEALCPNRIDLGIGRAPGGDMLTAKAINANSFYAVNEFPQQVVDLVNWLQNKLPDDHTYHSVTAMPFGDSMPEIWLLGSSDYSSALAAHLGTRFAFAHFINPVGGDVVSKHYRSSFQASHLEKKPNSMVCIFVICGETESDAEDLVASIDHRRVMMATGRESTILPTEEACTYEYSETEKAIIKRERNRVVLGTPKNIKHQLIDLKHQFEADELMILTITGSYASRIRSYERIATAFDL